MKISFDLLPLDISYHNLPFLRLVFFISKSLYCISRHSLIQYAMRHWCIIVLCHYCLFRVHLFKLPLLCKPPFVESVSWIHKIFIAVTIYTPWKISKFINFRKVLFHFYYFFKISFLLRSCSSYWSSCMAEFCNENCFMV